MLWILVPIVASFLFSICLNPWFISMYFFISFGAFCFLYLVCLDSIRKQWLKNGLIYCVVLSLVRLFAWYSGRS